MGIDEKTRIVEVFNKSGHVYASTNGYMSIRVYTKDQACADFITRKLGASCRKHKEVYEISVTRRKDIARAAVMLIECPDLNSTKKDMLKVAVKYARANTKQSRLDLVAVFRKKYYSSGFDAIASESLSQSSANASRSSGDGEISTSLI